MGKQISLQTVRNLAAEVEFVAQLLKRVETEAGAEPSVEFAGKYSVANNVFRVLGVPGVNGESPADYVFTERSWIDGRNSSFIAPKIALDGQALEMGKVVENLKLFNRIGLELAERLAEYGMEPELHHIGK